MTPAAVLAFPVPSPDDLNPLKYLSEVVVGSVTDAWTTAMLSLWAAGLWLTRWVFGIIGALSTPDVSETGPLRSILATTLWISFTLAMILMFAQLIVALVRRDGQSIGRLFLGVLQYGLVWATFLGCAAGMVAAAAGLEHAILRTTLGVDVLGAYDVMPGIPRDAVNASTATVLGITSILLLLPGGFFALLIGLTRAAALIILVAVMPITASGLLSEATRPIFWKSFRWFIAGALIPPTTALVFGIGAQVSEGVVDGDGDKTAGAIGTGVVGAVMVAVATICPLALYRLLAWVDPGTPSGAALRQSWSDAGGIAGLTGATRSANPGTGASPATTIGQDGRSGGEATADAATGSRMAAALSSFGTGVQIATSVAMRAGDLSADILGGAGVGSPGYSMTPADERALRAGQAGGTGSDTGPAGAPRPGPQTPPGSPGTPGTPGAPGLPGPAVPPPAGTAGSGSGGAGAGAKAAGTKAAGAAVV
jgi:type IV secretion system protein TrbL